MIVVADTSPLLNLARIGRIELLPALYKQVLVPTAVSDELEAFLRDLPNAKSVSFSPWMVVAAPQDQKRVSELRENLDFGEAEAIALAIEVGAHLLLVDELLVDKRRGRRLASTI